MLATVRHNLIANHRDRVRRERRFEAYVVDPASLPSLMDPGAYREHVAPAVRRLLGAFDRCRVFLPDEAESVRGAPIPPGAIGQRVDRYLDQRGRLGELEAGMVAGLRRKWVEAGAQPGKWLSEHCEEDADGTWLSLTDRVCTDDLFWWWVWCGGLNVWLVLRPAAEATGDEPLHALFDPFSIGGEGKDTWVQPLAFARKETARSDRWRLMTHPHSLYVSVVGRDQTAERLFVRVVERATLTRRLWPPS